MYIYVHMYVCMYVCMYVSRRRLNILHIVYIIYICIGIQIYVSIQIKQDNLRKASTSASLTLLKALIICITTSGGQYLKKWEYQATLSASCKTCMRVRNNS